MDTQGRPQAPSAAEGCRPLVLVVDDEYGPRESLRLILDRQYDVITVDSAFAALDELEQRSPEVILSDIRMPGMDGIEFMVQARERCPEVPFVIITGNGTLETAQEAIRAGAVDYISKPYRVEHIREVVARAIKEARSKAELARSVERLREMNANLALQMEELERKASLGELSAELVHDLNNPLCILQGYTALLADSLADAPAPDEGDNHRVFDIIREQIKRCSELTRNFLDYARGGGNRWECLEINNVLRDTSFLLRVRARALRVTFREDFASDLPPVWGQRAPLQQVFYNLVVNALHVLEDTGGVLRLASRRVCTDDGREAVQVVVQDNGPGIPPEIRDRIFDSFFTTKPKDKGTGLGLPICRRVVTAHKGSITFESEVGRGTAFFVTFPAWQESGPPSGADAPRGRSARRRSGMPLQHQGA